MSKPQNDIEWQNGMEHCMSTIKIAYCMSQWNFAMNAAYQNDTEKSM